MCLLVVCKPNSTPSKQDLHNGACSNPHGYGFAIVADGRIITERSMSAKKSIRRFLQLREQYPNGYAMWHARYATHGVKNEQNCHPFQVGDDTQTYLAHNGVLDTFIETGDKRSDTRVFAEDTLPKLGGVSALNDENIYRMVESWATGSKIAVLTVNPVAEYQLYLINEKLGTWDDDGVWWSNSSYKRTVYDYTPSVRQSDSVIMGYSDDEKEFWEKQEGYINRYSDDGSVIDLCPMCEAMIDLEQSPETCEFCASCLYCFQLPLDCDCYDPKQKAHARGFDFDNEWTASKSYDSLLV
jgi:hypothetical protein